MTTSRPDGPGLPAAPARRRPGLAGSVLVLVAGVLGMAAGGAGTLIGFVAVYGDPGPETTTLEDPTWAQPLFWTSCALGVLGLVGVAFGAAFITRATASGTRG